MNTFSPEYDLEKAVPNTLDLHIQVMELEGRNAEQLATLKTLERDIAYLRQRLTAHNVPLFDEGYLRKNPYEMTRQELLEANKMVTARHKGRHAGIPKKDAVPFPTYEQQEELMAKSASVNPLLTLVNAIGANPRFVIYKTYN